MKIFDLVDKDLRFTNGGSSLGLAGLMASIEVFVAQRSIPGLKLYQSSCREMSRWTHLDVTKETAKLYLYGT